MYFTEEVSDKYLSHKKMHVTVHQYCKKMAIYSYSEAIKTLVLYL